MDRSPDSPGQVLKQLIREKGLTPTLFAAELSRICKVRCDYRKVYRWTINEGFTPENQLNAARTLRLSADVFTQPKAHEERLRATQATLEKARLYSPIVRSLDDEAYQVLRTIAFESDRIMPTVAFYETVASALRGLIRQDEIVGVAALNARIDASLAHKPPLKPQKKGSKKGHFALPGKRKNT